MIFLIAAFPGFVWEDKCFFAIYDVIIKLEKIPGCIVLIISSLKVEIKQQTLLKTKLEQV